MKLPAHRVRVSPVPGSPYRLHEILLGDTVIRSTLSPYSEQDIRDAIHAHLHPQPPRPAPVYSMHGRNTNPRNAGRPRKGERRSTPEGDSDD